MILGQSMKHQLFGSSNLRRLIDILPEIIDRIWNELNGPTRMAQLSSQ